MSTWPLEGTTPLIADRFINTYIAAVSLQTIGTFVEITGDNTVNVPTGKNSLKVVGVTLTKAAAGAKVSVVARGICRVIPFSSITAGDQITSSGGSAITDSSTKDTTILGICIQGGTSAGTAIIELW